MNWKITIGFAFFSVVLSDSSYAQYVADNETELIHQMMFKRAVVKIDDVSEFSAGSGFIIREDDRKRKYLLTNAHVGERGHELWLDLAPHGSVDVKEGVELLAHDEKRDLALLRFRADKAVGFLPIERRKGRALDDKSVLLVGFPGEQLSFKKLSLVHDRVRFDAYESQDFYISSRFGAGGSGSPVISYTDETFHVIGVYRGWVKERGVACYEVEEFLEENGYGWLMKDSLSDQEKITLIKTSFSIAFEKTEIEQ